MARLSKKNDDRLANLLIEVMKYAEEHSQYSYYELEAYMYSGRPEWEPVFTNKKSRAALSEYLKSARRELKIKVGPMVDSYKVMLKAKTEKIEELAQEQFKDD